MARQTYRDPGMTQDEEKKRSAGSFISSFLFYLALFIILMTAFAYSQGNPNGRELLGYRTYNILTTSMESVIPHGSLIVVKTTDPSELVVGQDITFYRDKNTVVTHRIEEITQEGDHLVFTTKGVDNTRQDPDPVYDDNVVGKVVFHVPKMGGIFTTITSNVLWIVGALVLLMVASFAIRLIFTKDAPDPEDEKPPIPPPAFLDM